MRCIRNRTAVHKSNGRRRVKQGEIKEYLISRVKIGPVLNKKRGNTSRPVVYTYMQRSLTLLIHIIVYA